MQDSRGCQRVLQANPQGWHYQPPHCAVTTTQSIPLAATRPCEVSFEIFSGLSIMKEMHFGARLMQHEAASLHTTTLAPLSMKTSHYASSMHHCMTFKLTGYRTGVGHAAWLWMGIRESKAKQGPGD